MMDVTRALCIGAAIAYALIGYWVGLLGWADAKVRSHPTTGDANVAHVVLWIPQILKYTQSLIMLNMAMKLRNPRRSMAYKVHCWAFGKLFRDRGFTVVPISTSSVAFQQLTEGLAQNLPFFLMNVILVYVAPEFVNSASVGGRTVMTICPAAVAWMFTIQQARGECPTRLLYPLYGLGGFVRLPRQWGGLDIVKFTVAPGGPYMEYVGEQVCLSPGWTPYRILATWGRRMWRPPLPSIVTMFFPVTAPLWVWSLEGKNLGVRHDHVRH